ncbi:MAG: dppD [Ramlibacter sp.]|nr:dppD [Ramlibacter sp.]
MTSSSSSPLLSIEGLRTVFATDAGELAAVDGVDLTVYRGRTLGIVGESGCGKSMLSLSVMGLLPSPGRIAAGRVVFDGEDLARLPAERMRALRGKRIAMVFQEPMTSLNPVYTIGFQIVEAMRAHEPGTPFAELKARAIAALERVRITAAAQRFDDYPHQLSGGMRQRVMIAMALACSPDLLIADEPTTALDVTVQAQVLDLLRDIQRETHMAIVLITHDLGVVAGMADEVAVMYAGRIVERAPVADIFNDPQHPYTLGLLGSMPRIDEERERLLVIEGSLPPPGQVPRGCRFHPRCVFGTRECTLQDPPLLALGPRHVVACIHAPVERFMATLAADGVA